MSQDNNKETFDKLFAYVLLNNKLANLFDEEVTVTKILRKRRQRTTDIP